MVEVTMEAISVPDLAGPIQVDANDTTKLSIAEMSETFGVTLRALRFYEEKGLLRPERRGARRFYGARDIGRMRVILQAKRIGLTLIEIREVISLVEGKMGRAAQLQALREICARQEEILKEQQAQLSDQVQEMSGVLAALDGLLQTRANA
ncbi:MerR family transcriptional regulator [Stappia taiwanensis]|uniref:MerR family transcriptional regulator n=2 Tax=Stappia taiwanensis TaxID=992267 RepID=A0A838XMW8_9HYPH|nr:MerR family transcriptional regulator [Stappia taiwanensis]GGE86437.1 transcriptional regulator [Stappia taiwanensis]